MSGIGRVITLAGQQFLIGRGYITAVFGDGVGGYLRSIDIGYQSIFIGVFGINSQGNFLYLHPFHDKIVLGKPLTDEYTPYHD